MSADEKTPADPFAPVEDVLEVDTGPVEPLPERTREGPLEGYEHKNETQLIKEHHDDQLKVAKAKADAKKGGKK